MPRVRQQKTRQMLLVTEGPSIDPLALPEKLQLFDANGAPADLSAFIGIPGGGSIGQVLAKLSADDYDIRWINPPAGSGGGGPGGNFEGLFEALDVELDIPDNGAAVETPVLTITDDALIGIDTVLILEVWIEHSYLPDCSGYLIAPDDTEFRFLNEQGDSDPASLGLEGNRAKIWPGGLIELNTEPRPDTGNFIPDGDWSAMHGMPIAGDWKLRLQDLSGGDVGTVHEWALRFSPDLPIPPDDIDLPVSKALLIHSGTVDGPVVASIGFKHASDRSNNGSTVNSWPHEEWIIDEGDRYVQSHRTSWIDSQQYD